MRTIPHISLTAAAHIAAQIVDENIQYEIWIPLVSCPV